MTILEIISMPGAEGRDGIHLSAQLRVDAMQLQRRHIDWAARTMEQAAERIDTLENLLAKRAVNAQAPAGAERGWDDGEHNL
jgi:hypothetical protein